MIEMRVGQQNRLDVQTILMDAVEELVDFIPRVDHHARPRPFAGDDVPILEEGWGGCRDDAHVAKVYIIVRRCVSEST
jgi:hypothetical protein